MEYKSSRISKYENGLKIGPSPVEILHIINDNLGVLIKIQTLQTQIFAAYIADDVETLQSLLKAGEAL